jgi:hypothetical protein
MRLIDITIVGCGVGRADNLNPPVALFRRADRSPSGSLSEAKLPRRSCCLRGSF